MPGYPCCCKKPGCLYCNAGTWPRQMQVTIPNNLISSTRCNNCTNLVGTYILDSIASTLSCLWGLEFYRDLSTALSTDYVTDCSTTYPWWIYATLNSPASWLVSIGKKDGVAWGSSGYVYFLVAASTAGSTGVNCSTTFSLPLSIPINILCRWNTTTLVTLTPIP